MQPQSASLRLIAKGDLCCGCGGCSVLSGGKIAMETVQPGYLRPIQKSTLTSVEEKNIRRVCPGLNLSVDSSGRKDSILWGPYLDSFLGYAEDEELRYLGASGGVLSAISKTLLATRAVDGIVATVAHDVVPIENAIRILRSDRDVLSAAGSRYAPSSPVLVLDQCLREYRLYSRRFAFIGKPCDCAAVLALVEGDAEYRKAIRFIISFFCAGIPSHRGSYELLDVLGARGATEFRYRGRGWPGRATATMPDGAIKSCTYEESWGKILSRHVQHRCKICADGTGAAADIVCADGWDTDPAGYPVFEDAPGKSVIVVRTKAGEELLESCLSEKSVVLEKYNLEKLDKVQPGQRNRKKAVLARLVALRLVGLPTPKYYGLHLLSASLQSSPRFLAANFFGMLLRSIRRRRTQRESGSR